MSRRRLKRMLSAVLLVLAAALGVVIALALTLLVMSARLPDLRADSGRLPIAKTSIVYAADGTVLAEWYDEQDRTVVPNDRIPVHLKHAAVAIEDKRFYEHGGVDPQSIARALSVNSQAGEVRQGGSTITQQTVKLLFTDGKRTLTRKVEEALLSLSFETRADKDDVLGVYLNTVYFGRGAYGVESAARRFFGVRTEELTLAECALLAGCIQSPTRYDPFRDPAAALERRNLVLREMRDQGYISAEEAGRAVTEQLGVIEQVPGTPALAPYFVEYVRRDLLERLGSETLYRGGLRIYTTLDPKAQRAAEAAAASVLPDTDDPEVAVAAVRWSDGAVVALVGGRDFSAEQFDLATQGRRQTGSAFKPFVLAAALEKGYGLDSTWDAAPFSAPVKDEVWQVQNYENSITGGSYTLREATVWSINTVYARVIMAVGPESVVGAARRMGITTPIDPDPAIALGGLSNGVSPLEMASAYGTIANGGVAVAPSGIARVTNDRHTVIYAPERAGVRAISKDVAGTIAQVLGEVYTSGTGAGANFGQPGAVKTGTSQLWRDAWLVGYSGDLCTAVWVGYPREQKPMDDVHGIRVTGGSFPARVWREFMQVAAVDGRADAEEIAEAPTAQPGADRAVYLLCAESMRVARPDCPDQMELLLRVGSISRETCTLKH